MKLKLFTLAALCCAVAAAFALVPPPTTDAAPNFILQRIWIDESGNQVGGKTAGCVGSTAFWGTRTPYQIQIHTFCHSFEERIWCLEDDVVTSCSSEPFSLSPWI